MYHFLINPNSSSGKGIRYWQIIEKELEVQNISYTADFTQYEGHATELAEEICRKYKGIKNIVVLGGDGTLNEVINGIDNYDEVFLGYIPSGSSNDLARSLKISKKPLKALSNVLKPNKFTYLDYGEITYHKKEAKSRKFICSSGTGYDASVCVEVQSSELKKKLNRFGAGKFVYLALAIKQLFKVDFLNSTILIDGIKKDHFKNVLLISGMIHPFEGGGLMMAPGADPRDGKLNVCLVHGMPRAIVMLLLPTIIFGKHIKLKTVKYFKCSSIEIISDREAAIHTDGETPAFSSHISIRCIPKKIRMIL
ncbi:diacylglycerol/lipid kinase family protein [Herbinix luporum]|jgi:YegS/Rv2252/BmrU family lipid kinase|uniref:diacylglycerol/lipid kinase family protein n=1 Tax=Herbinix luporum TaxID=1679721 RepID=UPI0017784BD4|nr:diacylglycerol kinase family protein [Herbinix luporum]MDI9488700.1 diacylglycerol kinase family lipid kinase [Bacillota bacterium]HHT57203.1 diacylglycerol kinase family lipid kinase [Herbinix luporum]